MWRYESPDIDDPSGWAPPDLSVSLVPRLDGLLRALKTGGPRSVPGTTRTQEARARSVPGTTRAQEAPARSVPGTTRAQEAPLSGKGEVARHLFAAADPAISALFCGSAAAALRELSRRSERLDERTRIEIAADDPASRPASFQALCDVLGVGLVVTDSGVVTAVSLLDMNVWLERASETEGWRAAPWSPASKPDAAGRVRRLAVEAASKPETSMQALRKTAADVGLPRPFPRSKAGLGAAVRAHLASHLAS